jgi:hypothetical protein
VQGGNLDLIMANADKSQQCKVVKLIPREILSIALDNGKAEK